MFFQVTEHVKGTYDRIRDPKQLGKLAAMCLGDLQPNNILWKQSEDAKLTHNVEAFVDLQIVHNGSCVFDIASLTLWAFPTEERRLFQDDILKFYIQTSTEKRNEAFDIPFADLKREYECLLLMFAVMYVPFVARSLTSSSGNLTDGRIKELVGKVVAVFEDSLALLDMSQ